MYSDLLKFNQLWSRVKKPMTLDYRDSDANIRKFASNLHKDNKF